MADGLGKASPEEEGASPITISLSLYLIEFIKYWLSAGKKKNVNIQKEKSIKSVTLYYPLSNSRNTKHSPL